VDELVNAKLRKAGIIPSPLCSDAEFLRRASLDVTGTLPTPREVETFLADKTADKRDRKIDELLERPGYAAWWTTKLCDFTGNNPAVLRGNNLAANLGQVNFGPQLSRQWFDWVYERISQNKPYDALAAGIVLGSMRARPDQPYDEYVLEMSSYFRKDGASFGNRETMPWFWARQNVQKPEDKALAFAHTFLGVRIECAQCHKHPFDQCGSSAPSVTSIPLTSGPSRTLPSFRLFSPGSLSSRATGKATSPSVCSRPWRLPMPGGRPRKRRR
jgi:hypothetical protein